MYRWTVGVTGACTWWRDWGTSCVGRTTSSPRNRTSRSLAKWVPAPVFWEITGISDTSWISVISDISGISYICGINNISWISDISVISDIRGISCICGINNISWISDISGINGISE